MRILIIDRDPYVSDYARQTFHQVWLDVDVCGDEEIRYFHLEDYEGLVWCSSGADPRLGEFLKTIRGGHCQLPILVLLREDQQEEHVRSELRARALEQGADYCMTLPAEENELLAVMKAMLRRRGELLPERLTVGDMTLDQATFILSGPEGSAQLGKREYDVIRMLMINRGIVVSKETLLQKVWGEKSEAVDNNVEVYISFLRKKMDALGVHVSIITIRRLGYKLTAGDSG